LSLRLSSWYPVDSIANLRMNTLWDGIFHSLIYVLIVTGPLFALACGGGSSFSLVPPAVWRGDAVRLGRVQRHHAAAPGDPMTSRRSARAGPWLMLAVGLALALAPIWRLAGVGFEPTLEQLLQVGCLRDRAQAQFVSGRME
jgi:hypothetical protein